MADRSGSTVNKGFSAGQEKDLAKAGAIIDQHVGDGWVLQQITTPDDGVGAMIGVFYKENRM